MAEAAGSSPVVPRHSFKKAQKFRDRTPAISQWTQPMPHGLAVATRNRIAFAKAGVYDVLPFVD